MKILVINSGSSSIKYQLFSMRDHSVMVHGVMEKIGEQISSHSYEVFGKGTITNTVREAIQDHQEGLTRLVEILTNKENGILADRSEIDAVGHRVVHGGEMFQAPTIIDDQVITAIKKNSSLAPLHNPPNIVGIETARTIFPTAVQVAVFDTAFHQTIPPKAYLYALPYRLYSSMKIRRYGFHGTSHHYVAQKAADLLGKPLAESNLISVHLGNGGSVTAIQKGESVDTSMGMTPLEGLIMGTRCGDIDPSIPCFLLQQGAMTVEEVDTLLNSNSGLRGVCGENDMRNVLQAIKDGDSKAKTAFEMYTYRVKKYIGAYLAVLGKTDAIIFTAGIGEHSSIVRQSVCQGLEGLGLEIDPSLNISDANQPRQIQKRSSRTKIFVIPTNEELKIAQETEALILRESS